MFWRVSIISQYGGRVGKPLLASLNQCRAHSCFNTTTTGGNHFRAWKQNGSEVNTGAWFLGCVERTLCLVLFTHSDIQRVNGGGSLNITRLDLYSLTKFLLQDYTKHHMIVPNGYNIGRDFLVEKAVAGSWWRGISWVADVEWREGLIEPGFRGIDHASIGMFSTLTRILRARNQPCHRTRWLYCDLNGPPGLINYSTYLGITDVPQKNPCP